MIVVLELYNKIIKRWVCFPWGALRTIGLLIFLNLSLLSRANKLSGPYALSGGCITTAPQYVLYNNLPATITATAASGGSCTSYSYQWQRSTDNIYFTDIPGATGQNLSFTTALPQTPQTTYFQRRTVCGNEVAYAGSAIVNMIAKFFYNVRDSAVFTRNNCASGATPATYTYVVPANKYSSPISQADADAKAKKNITDSGQYYANINAVCTWYSVAKSGVYTRNNCATGGTAGSYTYLVAARKYSSVISQVDADAKAQKEVTDSGQVYANRLATCTWLNVVKTATYTKNNCPASTTPTSVVYTVQAGKYSSIISQADADAKAQKDVTDSGQLYANTNGLCNNMFIMLLTGSGPGYFVLSVKNAAGTVVYQKNFVDGGSMLPFAAALPASSGYTIEIGSPEHMWALVNGTQKEIWNNSASWFATAPVNIQVSSTPLYYSAYVSGNYIKSCPAGNVGSTVQYSVYAGKYTSTASQSDADFKAQKELSDSGQTYANRVGTCTPVPMVNITLANYFPGTTSPLVTSVSFIRDGVLVQTNSFPSTATGSTTVSLPAGTYTMTFNAPGAPVGMPLAWHLTPQDYYYTKPYNSTTITSSPVTFVNGTAYTIQANRDL